MRLDAIMDSEERPVEKRYKLKQKSVKKLKEDRENVKSAVHYLLGV